MEESVIPYLEKSRTEAVFSKPLHKLSQPIALLIETLMEKPKNIKGNSELDKKLINFFDWQGPDSTTVQNESPGKAEWPNNVTRAKIGCFMDSVLSLGLDNESAVLGMIYLNRFCKVNDTIIQVHHWRYLTTVAVFIGQEIWNPQKSIDSAVEQVYTAENKNLFLIQRRVFIELIQNNLSILANTYARYFLELRSLNVEGGKFLLTPLSKEEGLELEKRSKESSEKISVSTSR